MACLDGRTLEGGGQILRIAVGLSALTASPIRITRIRGNRKGKRGLKAQHLAAVQWLAIASKTFTIGAEKESQTLNFFPGIPKGSPLPPQQQPADLMIRANKIDIGSAGSIGLVFQAILPFILFSSRRRRGTSSSSAEPFYITVHGGTNVGMSPSIDYLAQVLLPTLSLIGLPPISATVHQRGWLSGDRGAVTFCIPALPPGAVLPAFTLRDRGPIVRVDATLLVPPAARDFAKTEVLRALSAAFPELGGEEDGSVAIVFEPSGGSGKGNKPTLYLLLVATAASGARLGRDWLYNERVGGKGLPTAAVTKMARQVTEQLVAEVAHGGCVDEYMRDQLVVFQALAEGRSFVDGGRVGGGERVPPSLHARTAEWVVAELLGARCDGEGGCWGVGLRVGERFAERKTEGKRRVGERRLWRAVSADELRGRIEKRQEESTEVGERTVIRRTASANNLRTVYQTSQGSLREDAKSTFALPLRLNPAAG